MTKKRAAYAVYRSNQVQSEGCGVRRPPTVIHHLLRDLGTDGSWNHVKPGMAGWVNREYFRLEGKIGRNEESIKQPGHALRGAVYLLLPRPSSRSLAVSATSCVMLNRR
jgi:hypothetical protein